jgi:tetratricopeptide (TPR) repeat protein
VTGVFLLLAASVVVKQDQTVLRSGCETGASVIATVASGSPAQIRFAMSGEGETCYKVEVTQGSEQIQGYLPASALQGLDQFRSSVETAPKLGASKAVPVKAIPIRSIPVRPGAKSLTASDAETHPLIRANALIAQNQPRAALELLEKAIKIYGRDYQFLVAAGMAAYRADEARIALEYLNEAQALQPDRSVEQLIAKIKKESSGDKSGEKLYGTRFLLRYEGGNLAPEVARSMIALLEQEYSRISAEVGCRTDERIVTIVQSRQGFRDSTDAAEWSGGLFDGVKIRVPVVETTAIDALTRRALTHELVHACLASMGQWPTWLHEGMAQKLTGDTLPRGSAETVKALVREGKLPRLDNMNQSWSRMSTQHAQRAYEYALTAVDLLYEVYRNYGIHNIFRNPDRLPQITADLDKRLAQ